MYNVLLTTVCILFGHGLESVIEWRWWSEYPIWFIQVTRHYLIYNLIPNVFLTGLIKSTYLHTVVPVILNLKSVAMIDIVMHTLVANTIKSPHASLDRCTSTNA